jgi:flavin-dependent dehydrogenase
LLARLGLDDFPEARAVRADGMIVTGDGGVRVEARYPGGVQGRFISRTDLDAWLVDHAVRAGADVQQGARVVAPLVEDVGGARAVVGLRVARPGGGECAMKASIAVAADGRRSPLAFGLGLSRHPARRRRWATGAYFEGVRGLSSLGEMHIRGGHYIGVAPMPGGIANACIVAEQTRESRGNGNTAAMLAGRFATDPMLAARFSSARLVSHPITLGPLAVNSAVAGVRGLLLAGDAAGFVDPMTGDGLYFAMRGGELAAGAALAALAGRTDRPDRWLLDRREREFRFKRRFNRTLRQIVSMPRAVQFASKAVAIFPSSIERVVRIAGDVGRTADR